MLLSCQESLRRELRRQKALQGREEVLQKRQRQLEACHDIMVAMVTHGMVESMIVWAKVMEGNVLQGRLASPSHHTSPFAHEAALKQSRAAQACSSKHVQKRPRVE